MQEQTLTKLKMDLKMKPNHLRRFFLLIFLSFIISTISFSQKKFDVILLKSGGKVIGTILEKHENQSVILQLQSEEKLTIQWGEIKGFDVIIVQGKSIDEKINDEPNNKTDFPWKLISLAGDELYVNRLISLSDLSLFVFTNNKSISVPIDSIAVLVHFKEGHFWLGAGIGFVVGGVSGLIIGGASHQNSEQNDPIKSGKSTFETAGAATLGLIIGAPLGFFAGGALAGTDSYETYDLRSQKDLRAKKNILQTVIEN